MALESPAYVISAASHSAALFRQAAQSMIGGTGVVGTADLQVTANGTPDMSVNVAAGVVWCPGTLGSTSGMQTNIAAQAGYGLPSSLTAQGSYCAYNDATVNLPLAAADPTNPRIDLIVASIQDAAYAGSNNQPVLQVVTGTAAPSPAAPSAPASTVVLGQIAVAAGATSITSGNITDERTFLTLAGVSALQKPPLFAGWQATAQSIANNTTVPVAFDAHRVDTYSGHSNTTNNSRYTAQVAGWYLCSGQVAWTGSASGKRVSILAVNGTSQQSTELDPAVSTTQMVAVPAIPLYLNVGDYVELWAYQTSGAALSTSTSGAYLSTLNVLWVHS